MVQSAGILAYRIKQKIKECLLVHPGGPFYVNKDIGAWSIPKGEFTVEELPLLAAQREFFEETGIQVTGNFIELKPVKLKSGKVVYAWAVEFDLDASIVKSNTFQLEWPPKSGKFKSFPEIDKAEWMDFTVAKEKINAVQAAFIDQLETILNTRNI